MHEHPRTEGWFTLKGVPFVCNGYLNVHVDAARALLALLPLLSKKSCPGTIHGLLQDAFLRSAAMLLNVYGMYGETITVTVRPLCQIQSGISGFRDLGQDYKDGFQRGVVPRREISHVRHHVTEGMMSEDYTSRT